MFRYTALGWHPDSGCDTKICFKPATCACSQPNLDAYLKQVSKYSPIKLATGKKKSSFKKALPPIGSMLDHVESHVLGLNHIKSVIVNGQIRILQILSRRQPKPQIFFWGARSPLRLGHYGFQPNPWWSHGNVKMRGLPRCTVALLAGSHGCPGASGLCHAKWVSPLTSFFREDPPHRSNVLAHSAWFPMTTG